ncbi:hypothetical protein ONZ45_g13660 [Pleurotus djamor]|nr:hypothetical protein ONZ45_g13660 [Pleurotus djamor]
MSSPCSSQIPASDDEKLTRLLNIMGRELVLQYRDETIEPELLAISDDDEYSFENANEWVLFKALKKWYTTYTQQRRASTTPVPSTPSPSSTPRRSMPSTPRRSITPAYPTTPHANRSTTVPRETARSSPPKLPTIKEEADDEVIFVDPPTKRKRGATRSADVIEISDSEDGAVIKKPRQSKGKSKETTANDEKISRQSIPERIVHVDDFLSSYTHFDTHGKIITGSLVRRACPTKIMIISPVDRSDLRALVVLEHPHNHPMPAHLKPTIEAKKIYGDAARKVGVLGLSMVKLDTVAVAQGIIQPPSRIDPALANPRQRRTIIRTIKKEEYPEGTGLEGVFHIHLEEQKKLPPSEQYIHQVFTSLGDAGNVVVTMNPFLASLFHEVKTTLHDNTYKRIGVCIARIYMTRETRLAFQTVWTSLWDTVELVTGKPVKFKFMHGEGIRTILVDGSKPQMNGAGDDLVQRNRSIPEKKRLVHEDDPQAIVQHIFRVCLVHLDRDLDKLVNHISHEDNKRIRQITHLKTKAEIDELMVWCEKHSNKHIRDWAVDKKAAPWFVPTINMHHSKIEREDWILSPADTNMNEGSHPATNQRTGIALSLLEAILTAREYDKTAVEKIRRAEEDHVLPNQHNTVGHRLGINLKRKMAKHAKSLQNQETLENFEEVDAQIQSMATQLKGLRALKKTLKPPRGVKARKDQGRAVKGKLVLADDAFSQVDVDAENDSREPDLEEPQYQIWYHQNKHLQV